MRVLLVGNHWTAGPGGAETMLLLTAQLLADRGHTVLPFAVDEPRAEPAVTRSRFPAAAGARARTRAGEAVAGVWSLPAYRALDRLVTELRPDVAHVHHVYERLTLSVLDVLRRRGVPTVMTLHDDKPVCPNYRLFVDGTPCTRCLSGRYVEVVQHRCLEGSRWRSVAAAADAYLARARGTYRAVDHFVAPSSFLRDRVVEGGLPAARVTVLPNPVRAAGRPRNADPARPSVLFAGRLVAEKGVRTLLDAAALLPPRVRLTVVGSGRMQPEVRSRVAAEALPVDLAGSTDPAGVVRLLWKATVAVVPSVWWENCPMAVLEAAAQGVPVVASAVGGIPELVVDGVTGRLVAAGDARALADAVAGLVADPEAARRMGQAAWQRARVRHDPDDHVEALQRCYAEVLAAAR